MASGIDWEDVRRRRVVRTKGAEPLAPDERTLTRDRRIAGKFSGRKASKPRGDTGQARRNENKAGSSAAGSNAKHSESIEEAREAIIRTEREKAASRIAQSAADRQRRKGHRGLQVQRPGDAEKDNETSAPWPVEQARVTAIQQVGKRRRSVVVEYKGVGRKKEPARSG